MGIYTSNRFFGEAYDYASEIPANEAYDAAFGCAHILADCQRNDMALFENSIFDDINEVRAFQEGAGYVNENAFTNIIKKIVEMFKKLLAKIKGIFKSFIAKLQGAFTNGKDLVKKYEKQIVKYSNWEGLKIKNIRVPENPSIKSSIDDVFQIGISNKYQLNFGVKDAKPDVDFITGIDGIENAEKVDKAEAEDIKLAIINHYLKKSSLSISDYKDAENEIMDKLFKDEDTIDSDTIKSSSFFTSTWVKSILIDDKWLKDVKKFNDTLEKSINTTIDNLNKADDSLASFMIKNDGKNINANTTTSNEYNIVFSNSDKNAKVDKKSVEWKTDNSALYDPKNIQKAIHALQKLAGNEQEVITKYTSIYMSIVKFTIAQARKIWTAGAAWSSGVHKESVEYYQMLGESAAEEFYMNMEAVC